MKNKNIYIGFILRIFIFIFLLLTISKNQDRVSRIIILPFLLCSLFSIGKIFFLMIGKDRIAAIFSKLFAICFFVFWFGFLVFGDIYLMKENNYFSLVFTIPFWIAGIYFVRKILFHKNLKGVTQQKESRFNFKIIISGFLVCSVLVVGIACLLFGIRDTYKLNKVTKGYLTTDGYFKDYDIYNIDKDGTTYKLIYVYKVGGKEYTISTDYGIGAGSIPEINSKREIKYNASDPAEAILSGTNRSILLIFYGAFFTLGGSVFVVCALYVKRVTCRREKESLARRNTIC